MDFPKKPLAKLESKDDRIAFRVPYSLKVRLAAAAVASNCDLSTYCRERMLEGHFLKESQRLYKSTMG